MPRDLDLPAFYALRSGGWRDLVTILHPPYTAWHLSYVAIGNAENAALLATEILALGNPALGARLDAYRADLTRMVLEDPSNAVPIG